MLQKSTFSLIAVFFCTLFTFAQQSILVINSTTKLVTQLNATDGSVINPNYLDLTALSAGTIKGLTQVDNKIWVSDQTQDAIYIYTLAGVYESTINSGLDNIRGLNVVNNEVWVTNSASSNGAPGNAIVRFSKAGVNLGSYPSITSPFDVLDLGNGNALITSFSTSGIQKMYYNGATTSAFVAAGIVSNPEQINLNSSGNIICSVFSSLGSNPSGIYEFSPVGVKLNNWPITTGTVRGVISTGDQNYLVSTSTGVYKLNPISGVSNLVVAGNFQFFTKIDSSLSVIETAENYSVNFYPNPVQNVLNISSKEDMIKVQIYSSSGRLLVDNKVKGKSAKVDFSKLAIGMYLVKIQNRSLKYSTIKVIKN